MLVFTDIFLKHYIIKSEYFNLGKLYRVDVFLMVIATCSKSKLTMSTAI